MFGFRACSHLYRRRECNPSSDDSGQEWTDFQSGRLSIDLVMDYLRERRDGDAGTGCEPADD